jgi:hypothetical protein
MGLLPRALPPLGWELERGTDGGINGVILFNDEGPKAKTKRIILSVKGGKCIGMHLIKDGLLADCCKTLPGERNHEKYPKST